jgi:hypothetical protein
MYPLLKLLLLSGGAGVTLYIYFYFLFLHASPPEAAAPVAGVQV